MSAALPQFVPHKNVLGKQEVTDDLEKESKNKGSYFSIKVLVLSVQILWKLKTDLIIKKKKSRFVLYFDVQILFYTLVDPAQTLQVALP